MHFRIIHLHAIYCDLPISGVMVHLPPVGFLLIVAVYTAKAGPADSLKSYISPAAKTFGLITKYLVVIPENINEKAANIKENIHQHELLQFSHDKLHITMKFFE